MTFVDLEKACDREPRKVLWWALRVVGVPEWLVKVVQAMYVGVKSRTRGKSSFGEEFEDKVGVHQGSVSSAVHQSRGSTLTRIFCGMSMGNALRR